MLGMFSAVAALFKLFPTLTGGGVPVVALPGDTDSMAATPQPELPAVRPPDEPRIDRTSFRLGSGQYLHQETVKKQIVLHFTAGGTARGAFDSWVGDPRTVATAYIVGLDGTIYECFDPKYWAFALGVKGSLARPSEQAAIQIEIVGWGPLRLKGDFLCSWPKNWTNRYCGLDETGKYVKRSFRGIDYFSAYPDAQFLAVAALVRYLCRRFRIPVDVPPPDFRGVCNVARANGFRGIVAHENYRTDKFDVGPAFDWNRLDSLI